MNKESIMWILFVAFLFIIPIGICSIRQYGIKKIKPTREQIKAADKNFISLCLFYWICDFFYLTFILDNLIWRFILGGLILVKIFYNLSLVFLNGNSPFKFGLVQDFLIGIGLTIYLIYIIPNEDLKQIVLPIVAALYGGLLTLVGVAWNIKKSDRDRKADDIKKAKPIFTYNSILIDSPKLLEKKVCFTDDLEFSKNYKGELMFEIENSDHSAFKIKRIMHDGSWFNAEYNTVVLPSSKVVLSFLFSNKDDIYLEIEDSMQQCYYYKVDVFWVNHYAYTACGLTEIQMPESKIENKSEEGEKNE